VFRRARRRSTKPRSENRLRGYWFSLFSGSLLSVFAGLPFAICLANKGTKTTTRVERTVARRTIASSTSASRGISPRLPSRTIPDRPARSRALASSVGEHARPNHGWTKPSDQVPRPPHAPRGGWHVRYEIEALSVLGRAVACGINPSLATERSRARFFERRRAPAGGGFRGFYSAGHVTQQRDAMISRCGGFR